MPLERYDEQRPVLAHVALVQASGIDWQLILTAGERGTRVDAITVKSFNTPQNDIRFGFGTAPDVKFIGNVIIPANAGNGSVPLVDALTPITSTLLQALVFPRGVSFYVKLGTALGENEMISVTVQGGEF
jgi:hypothetical protein